MSRRKKRWSLVLEWVIFRCLFIPGIVISMFVLILTSLSFLYVCLYRRVYSSVYLLVGLCLCLPLSLLVSVSVCMSKNRTK